MTLNSNTQQNHMDIWTSQSPVVLEICCGTASFSTAARTRGYTAVTVDIDPAFNPTHTCDVRGSYWEPTWKSKRGRAIECGRVPHALIDSLLDASPVTPVVSPLTASSQQKLAATTNFPHVKS